MRRLLALVVAALLVFGVMQTAHAVSGNPPGTTCTGHRYGKGGSKVCIRWTYPTTTTTVAP